MKTAPENIHLQPNLWLEFYGDYMFSYAITRVNDHALAEDIIQETFLAAIKASAKFKGNSSFKTWLTSILKRKIIDYYRKKSRKKEYSVEDFNSPFANEGIDKGHWKEDRTPDIWEKDKIADIHNEEFMKAVQDCISKLQDKWHSVFVLKTIEGMTTEDICKELDISQSNYWVIMHRSRLQLRECMQESWFKE